jgi:hypothetical protein
MDINLDLLVEQISRVAGINAIALGGSRSRNEAAASSDYDIGVYYDKNEISLAALSDAIKSLDDGHRPELLNKPGAWGPWINGGSWITVDNTPVDILLRELGHVKSVLGDCLVGHITIDYQCGHPFGFVNAIYAAETHYCIPLWESAEKPLSGLKDLLHSYGDYPPLMKAAIIKKFLWEAGFSLDCSFKPALRGDFNYAVGSVFRTVCAWAEVLYAINETYLMNEKGAVEKLAHLRIKPPCIEARIQEAYAGIFAGQPQRSFDALKEIHKEIEALSI